MLPVPSKDLNKALCIDPSFSAISGNTLTSDRRMTELADYSSFGVH
jgi:hypothetical protein